MIIVHLTGTLLLPTILFDLPQYMALQPDIESVHVFTRRLRSKLWSSIYYGGDLQMHFYQPIRWPLPFRLPNKLFPTVINKIRKFPKRQTILHLHNINDFSMPSFGKLLSIPGISKVFTTHDTPGEKDISLLLDNNVEIIAQSKYTAEQVNRNSGYYPLIISLGFNPSLFNDTLPEELARKKVGVERGKVLFWNGRISPEKDLPTFIDALPLIANELRDTPLTAIVKLRGINPWDNYCWSTLMSLNQKIGLYKRLVRNLQVKLDFPYKQPRELVPYYRSSDVLIHTSLLENFGLVFTEAMACGTPVVAANCATAPEIVGDCGLLFEPRNPQDLAEKTSRLLSDDKLHSKLSNMGKKKALTMYNIKKTADIYVNLYRGLLSCQTR